MAEKETVDTLFYQMVLSLHGAAMMYMGKYASPASGQIERDLTASKQSIDMLEMLQRKTVGNVSDEEKRMLDHLLYELRLNYVDELKKGDPSADSKPTGAEN